MVWSKISQHLRMGWLVKSSNRSSNFSTMNEVMVSLSLTRAISASSKHPSISTSLYVMVSSSPYFLWTHSPWCRLLQVQTVTCEVFSDGHGLFRSLPGEREICPVKYLRDGTQRSHYVHVEGHQCQKQSWGVPGSPWWQLCQCLWHLSWQGWWRPPSGWWDRGNFAQTPPTCVRPIRFLQPSSVLSPSHASLQPQPSTHDSVWEILNNRQTPSEALAESVEIWTRYRL